MARAQSPDDTPIDHDSEKPNHMILWLDVGIGDPTKYIDLKKAFSSNTDPRAQTWKMFNDMDVDRLLRTDEPTVVTFEGVIFLLQAFQNETDCLNAFERHQDKRIFFITSGSLGREAVPKIIAKYRHVFTDPISDRSYPSMYVFCHSIELQMDWAGDYLQYLQMFNFDSELLERMTRDIAEYFIERSERLRRDDDFQGALQRLHWSKKLWHQYDKMKQKISSDNPRQVVPSQRARDVDELLAELERLHKQQQRALWLERQNQNQLYPDERILNEDDDDVKPAETCS